MCSVAGQCNGGSDLARAMSDLFVAWPEIFLALIDSAQDISA